VQTIDAAAQPITDATAQAAGAVATAAQPLVDAAAEASQSVVQTLDVTAQPLVDVGSHVAATAEPLAQTVADATQPGMTTVGHATEPLADPTAQAAGAVAAAAQRVVDTLTNPDHLTAPIGATAHQLASSVGTAAQPALEAGAHAGTVVGATVDSGADAAISAAGSGGGLHLDLPPLDPAYLRYVGLAGVLGLTMQAAARWANAAGGCGLPTRLALRQFRLLPCLAFSSAEGLTDTVLAVASVPKTISGTAGQSVNRTGSAQGAATHRTKGPSRAEAEPGSSSGAVRLAQILLMTGLVALNIVLLAIRERFRRNNGE
jgi:hypothetical protein